MCGGWHTDAVLLSDMATNREASARATREGKAAARGAIAEARRLHAAAKAALVAHERETRALERSRAADLRSDEVAIKRNFRRRPIEAMAALKAARQSYREWLRQIALERQRRRDELTALRENYLYLKQNLTSMVAQAIRDRRDVERLDAADRADSARARAAMLARDVRAADARVRGVVADAKGAGGALRSSPAVRRTRAESARDRAAADREWLDLAEKNLPPDRVKAFRSSRQKYRSLPPDRAAERFLDDLDREGTSDIDAMAWAAAESEADALALKLGLRSRR